MALVAKYRLGGAAMWVLGMEEPAATTQILATALAIAPDQVVNTISFENVDQGTIYYGNLFTIKGLITLKDKTPIAGLSVALEVKRPNESTWTKVADLVSAIDGSVTTPMTLGANASIRLSTAGTWERSESLSKEEKISVKSLLQIDRPVSAAKGSLIPIKAQLLPKLVGKSANLQKNINGKWQNVGVASMSDENGVFTFTVSEAKRGIVTMRIQVIGDITSEQFAIVIR
jgi:hypothetical protein